MVTRCVLVSPLLCFYFLCAVAQSPVSLDQVGYQPSSPKYVFVTLADDSFHVRSVPTNVVVFSGPLTPWKTNDASTGKTIRRGDFSAFQQNGEFFITTLTGIPSEKFSISNTVYEDAYRKSLKGFYFQRCGVQLVSQFAGVYLHNWCHTSDGEFHSTTDTSGHHAATGGWHDAGDYNKYVVNAGISVGTLLMAYEYYPARFNQDDLNIPESGNGVPDILDEVRFELQWLLKMQRWDGGVWTKLTRLQFEGFVMPHNDSGTRYLYQVSSTATGDFAAMMARASRVYVTFDGAFAQQCRDAATRAWNYLVAHPTIVPPGGFRNPSDTGTGEYGDGNDSDERLWAAAELFATTGEATYNNYFQSNYTTGGVFSSAMSWPNVRSMGHLTYLKSQQTGTNPDVLVNLRNGLKSYCDGRVTRRNNSGYQVVLQPGEYNWGCNSEALNAAILLITGYEEFQTQDFLTVAADQMHYVLGANAHSLSFVTGVGKRYTRDPHHRPSWSDGVAEPVPGLLAGGPNQYRQDPTLQALFTSSTPPALVYKDTMPSYASNEIAINWNAPLVFVLGYFNGLLTSVVDDGSHGAAVPKVIRLEQNYPNPFNSATTISFALPKQSFVSLKVFDLLGREFATIVSEELSAGNYVRQWNAEEISSGVYLYRLSVAQERDGLAGLFSETKKLVLLR